MDEKIITILEEIRDIQKEYLTNQKKALELYQKIRRRIYYPLLLCLAVVIAVTVLTFFK